MKVRHHKVNGMFFIYIRGKLHFNMIAKKYVALQSWLDGIGDDRLYYITVYLKGVKPVVMRYTSKKLWNDVLDAFNEGM